MNNIVLRRLKFANAYLEKMYQNDYDILDLNMIEPFYVEDKIYHPTSIAFERNNTMMSIRSDWTRSILNYKERYHVDERKLAYFGPVIRDNKTIIQAGAEMYEVETQDIIESISLHLKFINGQTEQPLTTLIMNDEALLDLYFDKYQLDSSIRPLIYDKNISSLAELLGKDHSFYQLLTRPVSQQFDSIQAEFSDEEPVQFINQLVDELADLKMKTIVDLSFRSPQTYYNGFYFQIFLTENSPILSGGQYNNSAFGIGINLSNGGIV